MIQNRFGARETKQPWIGAIALVLLMAMTPLLRAEPRPDMEVSSAVGATETRQYTVEDNDLVVELLRAVLTADSPTHRRVEPHATVVVQGDEVTVTTTPTNLRVADSILGDFNLRRKMSGGYAIASWSLYPMGIVTVDRQTLAQFFSGVLEVVQTRLYARDGFLKAVLDGRRLWSDPCYLRLTIVDTVEMIGNVNEFLTQLEASGPQTMAEVVFFERGDAEEVAKQLLRMPGATSETLRRFVPLGASRTARMPDFSLVDADPVEPGNSGDDVATFRARGSHSTIWRSLGVGQSIDCIIRRSYLRIRHRLVFDSLNPPDAPEGPGAWVTVTVLNPAIEVKVIADRNAILFIATDQDLLAQLVSAARASEWNDRVFSEEPTKDSAPSNIW